MFKIKLADNRLTYLAWTGLSIAIYAAGFAIVSNASEALAGPAAILILLAVVVSILATIRRLNDLKWNRWMALITLVPVANTIIFLVLLFTPGRTGVALEATA